MTGLDTISRCSRALVAEMAAPDKLRRPMNSTHRPQRSSRLFIAAALVALLVPFGPFFAIAAPYAPISDAQVLERLPVKATDPLARELRDLQSKVSANTNDSNAALASSVFRMLSKFGISPRKSLINSSGDCW